MNVDVNDYLTMRSNFLTIFDLIISLVNQSF